MLSLLNVGHWVSRMKLNIFWILVTPAKPPSILFLNEEITICRKPKIFFPLLYFDVS